MEGKSSCRGARLERLERCGWRLVSDRVIHGIGHDLSGRASSMAGIAYLLTARKGGDESLDSLMAHELSLLEGAVRILRLLPDDDQGPELLVPAEILESLAELVRAQRGLEDVDIRIAASPDAPAIRGDRTLVVRSLALLLTRSAEGALTLGYPGVEVRVEEDRGRLALVMGRGEAGEAEASASRTLPLPPLPLEMEDAVREILEEEGVEMVERRGDDGRMSLTLRYPSFLTS